MRHLNCYNFASWLENQIKAGEWMGRVSMSTKECNYKEIDRQLKEQFTHGINDSDMSIKNNQRVHKNRRK